MNEITNADKSVLKTAVTLFKNGMCNKDVLILYDINESNLLEGFEFKFFDYNFFHLLGLRYTKQSKYNELSKIEANKQFLEDVISNRLSLSSVTFKQYNDRQKLQVITQAVSLYNVKFTGNYNYKGVYLNAYWSYGNSNYTLSIERKLSKKGDILYYFPISLLKKDIRTTTHPTFTVQAMLSKDFHYNKYERCIYATKHFKSNLENFTFNPNYRDKVDTKFYYLSPSEAVNGKSDNKQQELMSALQEAAITKET